MSNGVSDLSKRDRAALERDRLALRYGLAGTVVKTAGAVLAVYYGREIIISLAGRETYLALKIAFLGDFKIEIAFALAGFSGLWAVGERILRHRKIEALQARIKQLETQIDEKRSSSKLTPKGKTNPMDKTS
jgi:hypothetical protein